MNDRIKELERKCWDYQTNHLNAEKFAELIVRECAKAADEGMAQVTMRVEWPSYHIKKHFGVKNEAS